MAWYSFVEDNKETWINLRMVASIVVDETAEGATVHFNGEGGRQWGVLYLGGADYLRLRDALRKEE